MTDSITLVRRNVGPGLPREVLNDLFRETKTMLLDGISESAIAEALREWDTNPDLGPKVLPYLVGRVVRAQRARHSEATKITEMRDWEKKLQEELSG